MSIHSEIKSEIMKNVSEFYAISKKKKFVPGETFIPYAGRVYDDEELKNLVDSSLEFWLTSGRYTSQFEKDLSHYLGMNNCLFVNSGSSANLIALSSLTSPKLGKRRLLPGDEVLTTACGFPTTLNPILQNNLIPVFLDIELGTYNADLANLDEVITPKTKAIFIPHTLGNPANIDKILEYVDEYKLWFIEDNCDSLGSTYHSKLTGSFGHYSSCSFYPAHHITTGEGGALLTNDPLLYKIALSFRDWGRDCWCEPGQDNSCQKRFAWKLGGLPYGYDHKYIYSHIGYNLKATDMQAAIGVAQLKKLPSFVEARKKNFNLLKNALQGYQDWLLLPQNAPNSDPAWFGFPILLKQDAPFTRNEIVIFLENHKIATRMLFAGNLLMQPAYGAIKYRIPRTLENSDNIMNNLFWMGVYPGLGNEEIGYMTSILEEYFEGFK